MSWKTRVRQSLLMLGLALCAAAAPAASVGAGAGDLGQHGLKQTGRGGWRGGQDGLSAQDVVCHWWRSHTCVRAAVKGPQGPQPRKRRRETMLRRH